MSHRHEAEGFLAKNSVFFAVIKPTSWDGDAACEKSGAGIFRFSFANCRPDRICRTVNVEIPPEI
jgi:hypothetical protein